MEAMWILAGRNDVKFLTEFNKRMIDYSDDGLVFNAPYGYRLRNGSSTDKGHDQLMTVIETLKRDPNSRQAVCQIWDEEDLHRNTLDKACNMSLVFRIREGKLCLTVYNRSNDMIWGAYGANIVQFSMIQEYIAAYLGCGIGDYNQVSNSYHVYTEGAGGEVWDRLKEKYEPDLYVFDDLIQSSVYMVSEDMVNFEHDINLFFNCYDEFGLREIGELSTWKSIYFKDLILPVLCVYLLHKCSGPEEAMLYTRIIVADDWRMACEDWLNNRIKTNYSKRGADS
jgi:thymidylate synthase